MVKHPAYTRHSLQIRERYRFESCWDHQSEHGGIGRRNGLKIRYQFWCVGSSPTARTNFLLTYKNLGVKMHYDLHS